VIELNGLVPVGEKPLEEVVAPGCDAAMEKDRAMQDRLRSP
jgi:hypothetical protein